MSGFLDLIGPRRFIEPAVIHASAARGEDWYPYAAQMPLTPEATTQPRGTKTTFILHSMAGPKLTTLEALWKYLSRTDITGECTWIGDLDGRVAQTVPVNTRADNNYRANPFATSIETQDRGSPTLPTTPWSDPLLAQLAGLAAWQVLHPRLSIPLRRADQGWNGGGIDGHRRYAEWSSFTGKTCPGEARWHQIPDVLDAAQRIVDWTPEQGDDDMTPGQAAQLDKIEEQVQRLSEAVFVDEKVYPGYPSIVNMLAQTRTWAHTIAKHLGLDPK